MRYIIILIWAFFWMGCQSKNTSASEQTENIGKNPVDNPVMGGPADIKITLTDNPINATVQIIGFYLDQNFVQDTVVAVNGILQYKNEKGLPQGLYYFMFSNDIAVQAIIAEDQQFEMSVSTQDMINTMQVQGSEENALMYETFKYENNINPRIIAAADQLKQLTRGTEAYNQAKKNKLDLEKEKLDYFKNLSEKKPESLFASFKYGGQNPVLRDDLPNEQQIVAFRNEFWDNVNFGDRRLLRTPMIGAKMTRYYKELTAQQPDSLMKSATLLIDKTLNHKEYYMAFVNWVLVTYEPGKTELMDAESVFTQMAKNYFTLDRAFWSDTTEVQFIQKRAMEMSASLVGLPAPDVVSTDNFGKQQSLLSKKADYLIVYLFNPDCENCQKETPLLYSFYQQNKSRGVDVFAIAIDTDDKQWKDYIQKNNLSWTNVYDPTNKSIYGKYFVDHTPEMYLINKERRIIGKNLKTFQIQTMIDKDKSKK